MVTLLRGCMKNAGVESRRLTKRNTEVLREKRGENRSSHFAEQKNEGMQRGWLQWDPHQGWYAESAVKGRV